MLKRFNNMMFRLHRYYSYKNGNSNDVLNSNNNHIATRNISNTRKKTDNKNHDNNKNNNNNTIKKVIRFRYSTHTLLLLLFIGIAVIMNISKQNCIVNNMGPIQSSIMTIMTTTNDTMMNNKTNEEEYKKSFIINHRHWNELNSTSSNNTYIHEHVIPNRILMMHKYNLLNTTLFLFDNITNITNLTDIKDLEQRNLIALQRNVYNIIQHHPNAIIEFMTDKECIEEMNIILTKHFNSTFATQYIYYFQNEKHGMFRSDICRAIVLYEYGGLYYDVDLDVRYNSFHTIQKDTQFVTISGSGSYQYWFQAFIGVVPYHPVMKRHIELFYMYYDGTYYTSVFEKMNMHTSLDGWPLLLGPYLLKEAFFDIWKEQRQQLLQNNNSISLLTKDDHNIITDNNVDPSLYYNITDLYQTSELWYEILYYKKYSNTFFNHISYPGDDIFVSCKYFIIGLNRLHDLIPIIPLEENLYTPTNRHTLLKSVNEYYINVIIPKWRANQMDLYKMNHIIQNNNNHSNHMNYNNQQQYNNGMKCHNNNNVNSNLRIEQRRTDMVNDNANNNNQNDTVLIIPMHQLIPVPFGSRIRFSEECSDLIDVTSDDDTSSSVESPSLAVPSKTTFKNIRQKICWKSIKRFFNKWTSNIKNMIRKISWKSIKRFFNKRINKIKNMIQKMIKSFFYKKMSA